MGSAGAKRTSAHPSQADAVPQTVAPQGGTPRQWGHGQGGPACSARAAALTVEHHGAQGWPSCSSHVWKLPIGHSASCARGEGHVSCGCCPGSVPARLTQPHFFFLNPGERHIQLFVGFFYIYLLGCIRSSLQHVGSGSLTGDRTWAP